MKNNCIVCRKEIADEGEVCESCLEFLKWKHKKKYLEKIREFRKLENKDSGSIKFRRKK
jgi:predicted nucleic acid-binding Zn ribbon protein